MHLIMQKNSRTLVILWLFWLNDGTFTVNTVQTLALFLNKKSVALSSLC